MNRYQRHHRQAFPPDERRYSVMKPADLWTLFPATALLGFAGWVALMVSAGDPAAVILFVAAFLGAAWKACRWYHDAITRLEQQGLLPKRPE